MLARSMNNKGKLEEDQDNINFKRKDLWHGGHNRSMISISVAQTWWVTKPVGPDKELRIKVTGSSVQKTPTIKK